MLGSMLCALVTLSATLRVQAGTYGGDREIPTWRLPKELRGPKKTEPLVWGNCSDSCGGGIRNEITRGWEISCNSFGCDSQLSCECGKTDLMFVMDNSGSIGKKNFWKQKQFIQDVMHGMKHLGGADVADSRVAMVNFANEAAIDFDFTDGLTLNDLDALDAGVWAIEYLAGHTNTSGGLNLAGGIFAGSSSDNKRVAVLLTDGVSTRDIADTIPAAQRLKQEGVGVFAIGIGDVDDGELEAIVTQPPSTFYFKVEGYNVITSIIDQVIEATCCIVKPPVCVVGETSDCSVTCGGGTQAQTSACTHYGFGDVVVKEEPVVVTLACNEQACPQTTCEGGQSPGDRWKRECTCAVSGEQNCEQVEAICPAANGDHVSGDEWIKTCSCTAEGVVCHLGGFEETTATTPSSESTPSTASPEGAP